MTTIANNLIAALTATFRADSQDLLTTVKDLVRAWDANPDKSPALDLDFKTYDAIYLSVDAIKSEVQERIAHETDQVARDSTYPRDLVLHDMLACIDEFFN